MSDAGFGEWFERTFGAPLPLEAALSVERVADHVWMSERAKASLGSPPMMPELPDLGGDYVVAGHWGYGTSSWAFYWIEVRGTHQRFFRLPWGGAYGDAGADAAHVRAYLAGYDAWRRASEGGLRESRIVSDMGADSAHLVLAGGRVVDVDGGLPAEDDHAGDIPAAARWWRRVAAALQG